MAENTHISWADHTFNPWIGCTKVGPACDGCYAEAMMGENGRFKRTTWGKPGQRATHVRTAPGNWSKVRKWDREAKAAGRPVFVFCASLADVFDKDVPWNWRQDLFMLMHETPNLTWLLLTKRPGMIVELFHQAYIAEGWPPNAAIMATVVTQKEARRDIPALKQAARVLNPAFVGLSMEPLLEAVDLTVTDVNDMALLTGIDWVITGGETDQGDHKARPTAVEWFRSLRDQCAAAGVPYHHKQNGEWGPLDEFDGGAQPVYRLGKDRTGRALDGQVHDARPEVRA